VVAGPPPRPLNRYEWKVQDGVLYAGGLYRVKGES
jgi:Rieske Fe-S protein